MSSFPSKRHWVAILIREREGRSGLSSQRGADIVAGSGECDWRRGVRSKRERDDGAATHAGEDSKDDDRNLATPRPSSHFHRPNYY